MNFFDNYLVINISEKLIIIIIIDNALYYSYFVNHITVVKKIYSFDSFRRELLQKI